MELKDKVAIITGSARGIGAGIALAFAREGASVVVNGLTVDSCDATVNEIRAAGGKAIACAADVSKFADQQAMVAAALKAFGRLDILVNNAGIESTPCLIQDMSEAQWDKVLGINLKGVFLGIKAVLPPMMAQKSGRIINISSTAGLRMTFFGSVDYTVSKHGVTGLTNHLAWELADHNITVNTICPGGVLTPLMEQHTTPEFRQMVSKRLIPLGRMCSPDEIGQAAVFFASDRSKMVTGQLMAVDGGLMTGFGEDLRPLVRKRMEEAKQKAAHAS
jgi:3-oxoacyl-[acyl-carrier protein] reductase